MSAGDLSPGQQLALTMFRARMAGIGCRVLDSWEIVSVDDNVARGRVLSITQQGPFEWTVNAEAYKAIEYINCKITVAK